MRIKNSKKTNNMYINIIWEEFIVRFTKGLMIGSLITAGTMMIYSDGIENSKKKIVRKGKKLMKKIGM